jgi:hypothetical protein
LEKIAIIMTISVVINRSLIYSSLFTPDASDSYGAQWTRDFAYMLMEAHDLIDMPKVLRVFNSSHLSVFITTSLCCHV